MNIQDIFFYVFAFFTVACAVMVVGPFTKNPVTSAMFLVLTIVCMAGLFVLLHAFFLAAVQILVYAGAVMVLFLFVIMLLDLKVEERRKIKLIGAGLGTVAVGAIAALLVRSIVQLSKSGLPTTPQIEGGTTALGTLLFKNYVLPFEIVSLLLLVAMVGVILLSKKDLK